MISPASNPCHISVNSSQKVIFLQFDVSTVYWCCKIFPCSTCIMHLQYSCATEYSACTRPIVHIGFPQTDAPCPSGWIPSPSEDDISCYYISNTTQEVRATWYESRDLCQKLITKMDGYLLAINNQEELVRQNLYSLLVIDSKDFMTYFILGLFKDTSCRQLFNSSMVIVNFLKLLYNFTCSRPKLKGNN